MHVFKLNKPILEFPADHPARRFLEAFVECRKTCVGREIDGVDQQWFSQAERRARRFSSFAYEWLSFDVELDGWLKNAAARTESEAAALEAIPRMERLVAECKSAAAVDNNSQVVALCDQVLLMARLWAECIHFRLKSRNDPA